MIVAFEMLNEETAKYLVDMDPHDREILVLDAMLQNITRRIEKIYGNNQLS